MTTKAIFDVIKEENLKGKTILLITHDAGKALYGNKTIVIADGKIVENGSPEELKSRGGIYTSLCEAQMKHK